MKRIRLLSIPFTVLLLISSCDIKNEDSINGQKSFPRFFSESSFWNQPIGENPQIDPNSEKWIRMLELEPTGENFSTVYSQWTVPVYEADETTPYEFVNRYQLNAEEKAVWESVRQKDYFGHGPQFNPVPIPENARPDKMTDAHFAVVDWNRMLAWDMWGLEKTEDGKYRSKTGMCYRLDGDGTFHPEELGYIDGESVHFHGPGRAAGVPVIAGLVRYDEVHAGKIEHKLSCATRFAATQTYTYPASWTDGYVDGGIPEGAVIQLDPALDLSLFELSPEEMVIARAMQEYGMVVVDIAQGQPLYVEGVWTDPNKSWEGELSEWENKGINAIPFKHYRVLKVENPVYRGDTRTSRESHRKEWLPGDLPEKLEQLSQQMKQP